MARRCREAAMKSIKKFEGYFTINDLAKKLNISWSTARQILMELVIEGKVEAQKTPKSWIFSISNKQEGRDSENERP
jgi:predicted ArsR family transcriptional regulator